MNSGRLGSLIFLLACLAVFVTARRQLDLRPRGGAEASLGDAPNSLYGTFVFGAFKPFFMEQFWAEADRAEREGRFWDLIDAQERLLRLAPDEPRIWRRQAGLIAFGVAQNEPEDRKRWRWYERAIAIVDRGIARHPDDFQLAELRFRIYFDLIAGDPYCSRQLGSGGRLDGLQRSLALAQELKRRFPEVPAAWDIDRIALEECAEYLMNRGRFREARELLSYLRGELFDEPWPFPNDPIRDGFDTVLDFGVSALTDLDEVADWSARPLVIQDEARLEALLDRLAELMKPGGPMLLEPDLDSLDASLAMLIHVRALELMPVRADVEKPPPRLAAPAGDQ